MSIYTFNNISILDTQLIINFILQFIKSGTVIALNGQLGTGKTYLTNMFVNSLGFIGIAVSPTFTLLNQYYISEKNLIINHFDVYRLNGADDLEAIGFFDCINKENSITIVEWAEKIRDILPNQNIISINISYSADLTARNYIIAIDGN